MIFGPPKVEAFFAWSEQQLLRIPGKSDLAKAFRYGLSRQEAFSLFLTDGRAAIDNNPAERALRPIGIGRKNWLFAGADTGAETLARAMTIIETTKLNGLNPQQSSRVSCGINGTVTDKVLSAMNIAHHETHPRFDRAEIVASEISAHTPVQDADRVREIYHLVSTDGLTRLLHALNAGQNDCRQVGVVCYRAGKCPAFLTFDGLGHDQGSFVHGSPDLRVEILASDCITSLIG